MTINDKITINVTNTTKAYYINLGYELINNKANIYIYDLPKHSGIEIFVNCDNCGELKKMQYRNYLKSLETYDKYYCNKCCHEKSEKTYLAKNNIKCIFQDKYFIENKKNSNKIKRDLLKENKNEIKIQKKKQELEEKKIKFIQKAIFIHDNKYNYILVNYITNKINVEIICNICGEHFFQSSSNHNNYNQNCPYCNGKPNIIDNSFINYKKEVRKETYKYKKKLYDNWNGYDYYDNEYIKDNFNLNSYDDNYPSLDHKTSIKYGFDNNISVEYIGNINNLCVTKRLINIKKGKKNHV